MVEAHTYLDFEIEIHPSDADGLAPVSVARAPGGEATGLFDLNALSATARIDSAPATLQEARAVGAELFDLLFLDQILSRYDVSRQMAALQQSGLRIRLRTSAPLIQNLPWELLFDARTDDFLALSLNTPIVRYLPTGTPIESLDVDPPLRILALIASPTDLPPVDRAAEQAILADALIKWEKKGSVELTVVEGEDLPALQTALQNGPWHVFHYVGHAQVNPVTGNGELLLADRGLSSAVTAAELAGLLADQRALRLCVLCACEGARSSASQPFSSLAAALVREGMPAVLAMREEISVVAARDFTRAFYGAVTANLPIDAAVVEARKSMRIAAPNSLEWATPSLYLRAPDALLWRAKPVRTPWIKVAIATLAALAVLVGIWFLVYAWAIPKYFPSQMEGTFRIAIANFGELDREGKMRNSTLGSLLSTTIYQNLVEQYDSVGAGSKFVSDITVWHDSAGRRQKNLVFGFVEGASAGDRAANARALAQRINADMVLYGYFAAAGGDSTGESGTTGSQSADELMLEYYYVTPELAGEPQPTAGNVRFGMPLSPSIPYATNPQLARSELTLSAGRRADALYWITQGLTRLLLDQPQQALSILTEAESALSGLDDDEGRDLLYLSIAQAAQVARDFDRGLEATDHALNINPAYVNAMILKGDMLLDRSQLFYLNLSREQLSEAQLACTTIQDLDRGSQDEVHAKADAEEAVFWLEQAVDIAPNSPWPLIEAYARQDLGFAYRLLGQIELRARNYQLSMENLDRAVDEFDRSIGSISVEQQPQYYGWALSGIGIAQHSKAGLLYTESVVAHNNGEFPLRNQLLDESIDELNAAIGTYDACIALDPQTEGNPIFQNRVLDCTCRLYRESAETTLAERREEARGYATGENK